VTEPAVEQLPVEIPARLANLFWMAELNGLVKGCTYSFAYPFKVLILHGTLDQLDELMDNLSTKDERYIELRDYLWRIWRTRMNGD
jgi:hypothetical protein